MTTISPEIRPQPVGAPSRRLDVRELRVSSYDQVSSWLLALLLLCGGAVAMLAVVWLSSRISRTQPVVPVQFTEIGIGDDEEMGGGDGLPPPAPDEVASEVDIPEPQTQPQMLAVVTSAVASMTNAPVNDRDPSLDEAVEGGARRGKGLGFGTGKGSGRGRGLKWEITFLEGNTLDLYAQQLDFFKVELGAINVEGDEILYAFNLSKSPPSTRTGPRSAEKRIYMQWRPGSSLREADKKLMAKAGMKDPRRIVVQFYPNEVLGRLQQLEKEYRGRDNSQIVKTRFAVKPAGAGYEFYVLEQIGK